MCLNRVRPTAPQRAPPNYLPNQAAGGVYSNPLARTLACGRSPTFPWSVVDLSIGTLHDMHPMCEFHQSMVLNKTSLWSLESHCPLLSKVLLIS